MQLLGKRYESIFAALRARVTETAGAMETEMRASAQNATVLHGRRGIHSVTKTEEISASKWYLPWTWGKKKTISTVWQETYDYYALEEAEDRLRSFAAESSAFVNGKLAAAVDAQGVRASLLSETLLVLGGADVRLDPMYLRALAEEAVEKLQIAVPAVDADAACARIAAEFDREAAGSAQMKALLDALETAVAALHDAMADAVRQQTGQIVSRLPELTGALQDGMTASIHRELEEAERQSADRAAQSAKIQRARQFLQPVSGGPPDGCQAV